LPSGRGCSLQVAMARRTASWCSRLRAPRPDSQVAQTWSRSCFGTRYQWRRHIRRDGSIRSPQPGIGQQLVCSGGAVWPHGPRPRPPVNSVTVWSSVTSLVTAPIPSVRRPMRETLRPAGDIPGEEQATMRRTRVPVRRAINVQLARVTRGQPRLLQSTRTGRVSRPFRRSRSASQADSASSILVTRSTRKSQVRVRFENDRHLVG
jgi:hypothetical protein